MSYPFPVRGYYLEFTIRSTSFNLIFIFMVRKRFRTSRYTCVDLAQAKKLSTLIPLWTIACPEATANVYAAATPLTVELFLSKSRNFRTEAWKLFHVTQYTQLVLFGSWVLSRYYKEWRAKCLTIVCTHNTFLFLKKHLTSGTELILIGWKIVPNESL